MNNQLTTIKIMPVSDIMTMAQTFAESGMFSDAKKMGEAFVKIQAGQEIGIPPFAAMSGIHIIQGKPTIGAGLIAATVKGSGKYDYNVLQLDDKACELEFFQGTKSIGKSKFTIEDAKKALTKNIEKFPKNMLFARAISNGVKWYCPDVFSGPVYVPEEMEHVTEDVQHEEVKTMKPLVIGSKPFTSSIKAIQSGKTFEEVEKVANDNGYSISDNVKTALLDAVETAA